jgi:hypothetical protein
MWKAHRDGWDGLRICGGPKAWEDFKTTVFDLRLSHFPKELWTLSDLALIPASDTEAIEEVHQAAQLAWQQQVLEKLLMIWR